MSGCSELKVLLEAETFNEKMDLYLRPLAKAEITVKLPKVSCVFVDHVFDILDNCSRSVNF